MCVLGPQAGAERGREILFAQAADGAFQARKHVAAGRDVRTEVADAAGGGDGADAPELGGGADARGFQEAGGFRADVGQVGQGQVKGCFHGLGNEL